MARGTAQLVKIGLIGAGALYAIGESRKYGGIGPWLSQLTTSITTGVGAASSAAGTTINPSAAAASNNTGNTQSSGVYQGNPAAITAAARAAGVTSAGDPRADQYGAALWSLQAGQPMNAFYNQPVSVRATFDAVAIGQGK